MYIAHITYQTGLQKHHTEQNIYTQVRNAIQSRIHQFYMTHCIDHNIVFKHAKCIRDDMHTVLLITLTC